MTTARIEVKHQGVLRHDLILICVLLPSDSMRSVGGIAQRAKRQSVAPGADQSLEEGSKTI